MYPHYADLPEHAKKASMKDGIVRNHNGRSAYCFSGKGYCLKPQCYGCQYHKEPEYLPDPNYNYWERICKRISINHELEYRRFEGGKLFWLVDNKRYDNWKEATDAVFDLMFIKPMMIPLLEELSKKMNKIYKKKKRDERLYYSVYHPKSPHTQL